MRSQTGATRRRPRRDGFMDHEDRRRQPRTRDQRRTSLDERRQETRDQTWRRNIEAEAPSWSSIVKPLQPRILHTDEYKSKCRSDLILTHGGEGGSVKNFENSKLMERPGGSTKIHMGSKKISKHQPRIIHNSNSLQNFDEHEKVSQLSLVTRLGGAQKKKSKKKEHKQRIIRGK